MLKVNFIKKIKSQKFIYCVLCNINNLAELYTFKIRTITNVQLIIQYSLYVYSIDCVEEFSVNFLTNIIQKENLNSLIEEINKVYTPKFLTKKSMDNERKEILLRLKIIIRKS